MEKGTLRPSEVKLVKSRHAEQTAGEDFHTKVTCCFQSTINRLSPSLQLNFQRVFIMKYTSHLHKTYMCQRSWKVGKEEGIKSKKILFF